MEDITDADCTHVKRVFKDFKIKNLGEYHDLHVLRSKKYTAKLGYFLVIELLLH